MIKKNSSPDKLLTDGIIPVILSGGAGTRLWPLSREQYPKQLLPLIDDATLLQQTIKRLDGLDSLSDHQIVICNEEHRFLVAEQLRQIQLQSDLITNKILLEPEGRNTAPALTLAALSILADNNDAIMLVLPADHAILDIDVYHAAITRAFDFATQDKIVTLGITASKAETGFGYIKTGLSIDDYSYQLSEFVEKPDKATADSYIKSGQYFWNSGMFVMKASLWLSYINEFSPDIYENCQNAFNTGVPDNDFFRINKETFLKCESISIDYAVMEKITQKNSTKINAAVVVTLDAGWSDLGSWASLWQVGKKDLNGNVAKGDIYLENTNNSYIYSNQKLVSVLGLDNIVIVDTNDALLVAHKNSTQDVKNIVKWLQDQKREEQINHQKVFRPWGCYERIDTGERFQVKRITVNQGCSLSLQLHHHRAEHWIVVKGTAKVTRGDEEFLVTENQSTYIPLGVKHRLENQGSILLEMIEVQSGSYLGEDDIVRFEDVYGRVN